MAWTCSFLKGSPFHLSVRPATPRHWFPRMGPTGVLLHTLVPMGTPSEPGGGVCGSVCGQTSTSVRRGVRNVCGHRPGALGEEKRGPGQGTCNGPSQAGDRRVSPGANRRLPPLHPHLSHGLGRGGGARCGDRRAGRAPTTSPGHRPSSTAEAPHLPPRRKRGAVAGRSLLCPRWPPGGTTTLADAGGARGGGVSGLGARPLPEGGAASERRP